LAFLDTFLKAVKEACGLQKVHQVEVLILEEAAEAVMKTLVLFLQILVLQVLLLLGI
jgi:hypothetical protein